MSDALKIIQDKPGVVELRLNQPEIHNAFDDKLIQALFDALQTHKGNPNLMLMVISAEGKSFSAGADLNWMKRMKDYSVEENYQDAKALSDMLESLANYPVPTMALVNGSAYGGGIGLIACCDIAIAVDTAEFAFTEARLGLIPAVISPFIIKAMGLRQTQRYFLTAERFNAHEAQQNGLLHHLCPAGKLNDAFDQYVKLLSKNGPRALTEIKSIIELNDKTREIDIHNLMVEKIASIRISPEGQEGLSAFLEKRKPSWQQACSKES